MPTTISETEYYSRVTAPWPSLFQGWPFPELPNPHALGAKVVGSAYKLHSLTYKLSTWVRRAESCLSGWLNSHLFLLAQAMLQWQKKPCGCIWTLLPAPDRDLNSWSFILPGGPSSPQHEAGDGCSFLCQGKIASFLRSSGGLCHLGKSESSFQPTCKDRPFWEGPSSPPPLPQPIKAFLVRVWGMRLNWNR